MFFVKKSYKNKNFIFIILKSPINLLNFFSIIHKHIYKPIAYQQQIKKLLFQEVLFSSGGVEGI